MLPSNNNKICKPISKSIAQYKEPAPIIKKAFQYNSAENKDYYKYMDKLKVESNVFDEPVPETMLVENSNIYKYNALNLLNTERSTTKPYHTVVLCAYAIVNDALHPFIKYLLFMDNDTCTFDFPMFIHSDAEIPVKYSRSLIHQLLNNTMTTSEIENNNDLIKYKGCLHQSAKIYLFFDISGCKNDTLCDIYKMNKSHFAIMDEIINKNHICGMSFDSLLRDFFLKNPKFIFIQDENNSNYEIPIAVYTNERKHKLVFRYTFGVTKTQGLYMGNYYYFTSYNNALQCETTEPEMDVKPNDYGLVRFAVFLGTTCVKLNHLNDPLDLSDEKQRLMDCDDEMLYEEQTQRITDYDGKWSDVYDSVFVGNIKLEGDIFVKKCPLWVLKNYNQQHSLSYHYINDKGNSIL